MDKIVIVGAGEVGRLLAEILIRDYDITIIESNPDDVEFEDRLPGVTMVTGSCTNTKVLMDVFNGEPVKFFIAVCGNESDNIIACRIAKDLGAEKTICRLYKPVEDVFPTMDGKPILNPSDFGIDSFFSNTDLLVEKMCDVLDESELLEKFRFLNNDACVAVIRITNDCLLHATRLADLKISCLSQIRFAAVVRGGTFIETRGNVIFVAGDYVYIAGRQRAIDEFFHEVYPQRSQKRHIVILGGGEVPNMLAQKICGNDKYDISMVIRKKTDLDKIRSMKHGDRITAYRGNPQRIHLLAAEAEFNAMDVAISASNEDSDNILSGILMSHLNKERYDLGLPPTKIVMLIHDPIFLESIIRDGKCCFCVPYIFANEVLRIMGKTFMRKDAYLMMPEAMMVECKMTRKSPLFGREMREISMNTEIKNKITIALIFRGNEVIAPIGTTKFCEGDTLILFTQNKMKDQVKKYFPEQ